MGSNKFNKKSSLGDIAKQGNVVIRSRDLSTLKGGRKLSDTTPIGDILPQ